MFKLHRRQAWVLASKETEEIYHKISSTFKWDYSLFLKNVIKPSWIEEPLK